eukprot:11189515-Lingulodinium_polyedra.AAC.1
MVKRRRWRRWALRPLPPHGPTTRRGLQPVSAFLAPPSPGGNDAPAGRPEAPLWHLLELVHLQAAGC